MSKDPKYKVVKKFKRGGLKSIKIGCFWFDWIRYGLQALAGRRHRRTTRRD
jgi:hypothetical protein